MMKREKQNNKTAILEKLMESVMSKEVDSKGIEDLSRNMDSPDDAAKLVGKIERVMKSKKNNMLTLAYHQGLIFKKFKENSKFTGAVTNLKLGIIKFIDDYPKMRKSSVSLHFLKNNFE